MLGQTEVVSLLERCNGDKTAIEEVLSAYVTWKYLKGRSNDHVLQKLRTLTLYMRVTGRGYIIDNAREIFVVIATECTLGGQSRIGVLPVVTPVGHEVWNRVRRHASQRIITTDAHYGGPAPVQAFLTTQQRRPVLVRTLTAPGAPRTWSQGGSGIDVLSVTHTGPHSRHAISAPSSPAVETADPFATAGAALSSTAAPASPHPPLASPAALANMTAPTSTPNAAPTSSSAAVDETRDLPQRSPWMERYFRLRRQFGNDGVPPYSVRQGFDEGSNGETLTLPIYEGVSGAPSYHSRVAIEI